MIGNSRLNLMENNVSNVVIWKREVYRFSEDKRGLGHSSLVEVICEKSDDGRFVYFAFPVISIGDWCGSNFEIKHTPLIRESKTELLQHEMNYMVQESLRRLATTFTSALFELSVFRPEAMTYKVPTRKEDQ